MTDLGTLTQTDAGPELRFERRLTQGRDRVWQAITDPKELAVWFPAFMEFESQIGAPIRFEFPEEDLESIPGEVKPEMLQGEVLAFEPPDRFSFTWDRDVLTFELSDDGDGCHLVFRHLLVDSEFEGPSGTGTGWHVCFESLERWLDGEIDGRPPRAEVMARVEALGEVYERAFT